MRQDGRQCEEAPKCHLFCEHVWERRLIENFKPGAGVHVVVRVDNQYLLVRERGGNKKRANMLGHVMGKQHPNDNRCLFLTALRELSEETGILVAPPNNDPWGYDFRFERVFYGCVWVPNYFFGSNPEDKRILNAPVFIFEFAKNAISKTTINAEIQQRLNTETREELLEIGSVELLSRNRLLSRKDVAMHAKDAIKELGKMPVWQLKQFNP